MTLNDPQDHCWLHGYGHDLRIVEMRGLGEIHVLTTRGARWTVDLSDVDWRNYGDKAVELMRWQYVF